jgi:hypothetical protein
MIYHMLDMQNLIFLYKSTQNYFHEFGITISAVELIVKAKELQSSFHILIALVTI